MSDEPTTTPSVAAPSTDPSPVRSPAKKQTGPKTLAKVAAASNDEARRRAGVILEVLAGVRSTTDAASVLSVTLPRYYALEARAIEGLVRACDTSPRRGPTRSQAREIEALRREKALLERECARVAALARVAQRSLGLPAPAPATKGPAGASDPSSTTGGKKPRRRKRPVTRALVAARTLARTGPVKPAAEEKPGAPTRASS